MTNITEAKRKLIIIGGSGLLGSRITELLQPNFDIVSLSTSHGVDITKPETLSAIEASDASHVLHLAAKADVDGCEKDKPLGKEGPAWQINVEGARNVADICQSSSKTMIYVSTDFVFDGEKQPPYEYTEDDIPNPINWYSVTKYEGELAVIESGANHIILRTAYPYRREFEEKKDFVRIILSRLQNGEKVAAVTDHFMSPTYIDDIASSIDALIRHDALGIYHVVGTGSITPYEASLAIAREFGLSSDLIEKTTREVFFKDRAKRPFNLALKNAKITSLGVSMLSFEEGLKKMH